MKRLFMFAALATFVLAIPFSLKLRAPPAINQGGGTPYLTAGGDTGMSQVKKKKAKRKTKRKKAKRKTK